MELLLDRKWKKNTYTIGILYINNKKFCNTLEDKDRGLKQSMSSTEIKNIKIPKVTAIPTGTYTVRMDTVSPKYSLRPWYAVNCNGARMPRLENTPGFAGVLIHPGNTDVDTEGCILVGLNTEVGKVTNSKAIFLTLYNQMYKAYKRGEKITLTIK